MITILLLAACGGGGAATTDVSAESWARGWTGHLVYREVGGDPDGAVDTAGVLAGLLQVEVSDTGNTRTLGLRRGDTWADGTDVLSLELSLARGLSINAADGVAFDPPVALLTEPFDSGAAVKSGPWTVTPRMVSDLVTWYGVFPEALEIEIDGPSDGAVNGVLRLARDIGPVQFVLGDVAGDLAWYE